MPRRLTGTAERFSSTCILDCPTEISKRSIFRCLIFLLGARQIFRIVLTRNDLQLRRGARQRRLGCESSCLNPAAAVTAGPNSPSAGLRTPHPQARLRT